MVHLEQVINSVRGSAASLITLTQDGERVRLSLPIIYPSGAFTCVEIDALSHECFVSDCGLGYHEAEYASAQTFYIHTARAAAQHFGVDYDGMNVFALRASIDRLSGAIIAVANASAQAVAAAVLRAATDKERRANAELFDRVLAVFGAQNVTKQAELRGKEAEWQAHNVVSISGRFAVFEYVTSHQNSIANKYQMFSDLTRSENAPSLNSVVTSIKNIGSKGSMLADVSNMFEIDSSADEYRRFARLAA